MKSVIISGLMSIGIIAGGHVEAAEITLRAGHTNVADTIQDMGLQKLRELLEEKTNGRATIEIFPNGQLGDEAQLVEGVLLGTIDMAMPSNSVLSNYVNDFRVLDLPFMFKDIAALSEALQGPASEMMASAAEEAGFQLIGTYSSGIRHLMTKQPIEGIDDLEGLKIRTMQQPMHIETFRAFGANPTPMAYSELYGALQSGVVDGAEGATSDYVAQRFYEVAENWGMVGWLNLTAHIIMNKNSFEALPEDVQIALLEAGRESALWQQEYVIGTEAPLIEELEEKGVTITRPDADPFKEIAVPLYDSFIETESQQALFDALTAGR